MLSLYIEASLTKSIQFKDFKISHHIVLLDLISDYQDPLAKVNMDDEHYYDCDEF